MSEKNLLLMILGFVLIIMGTVVPMDNHLKEYNKHMCAVYGYYEDCKTPLPEELRLK